jgi:hypothetical protein
LFTVYNFPDDYPLAFISSGRKTKNKFEGFRNFAPGADRERVTSPAECRGTAFTPTFFLSENGIGVFEHNFLS